MAVSDFQLNSMVHRMVVSVGFDSNLLSIGVFNGVVYIKGELQKQDPATLMLMKDFRFAKDILNAKIESEYKTALTALDREIKALPGFRGIVYQLKGWRKSAGGWIKEQE